MTKKLLFRHTSTLLRTAFLLGALAFVNTQTKAQIAGLPDAFTTVDPIATIGNGQYYYIQFFDGDESSMTRCYLSDQGAGNNLRSKDYLPFAKNIQWKLVSAGSANQFYLQSGLGNYVKLNGTNYVSTSNSGDATALTAYKSDDGSHYEISTAANTATAMYRNRGRVWAEIIDGTHTYDHQEHNMTRCFLRIAKLKDNIAHIIYYQDPIYNNLGNVADANGEYRGGAEGFGKRHYLTYSGTGAQGQTNGWTSVITNGGMAGSDVSCFFKKEQGVDTNPVSAKIVDGEGRMGGRGILIQSSADATQDWDTQFFIRSNEPFSAGTVVHLEFDCKASQAATVSIQGHGEPGDYVNNDGGGYVYFTTQWQHIVRDIPISGDIRSFAFNLSVEKSAVTYVFDNIVFSVQPNDFRASDISSRSSVMETYDSWSFVTAAKYHEDGLWVLEKGDDTSDGAEFYIKKYGTSQYLHAVKDNDNVTPSLFYCELGSQDATLGRYVLEQPNNNRYTRIKNNTNSWGYTRYLSYSEGDGWPAMQLNENNTNPNFWQAGFLPVAVPDQDNFYRVLLGVKKDKKIKRTDNRIKLTGAKKNPIIVPAEGSTLENLYGATFTPTQDLTNVFQIENLEAGCYDKIVIKFGSPVPAGWHIHAYGPQANYFSLEGRTEYVIDLSEGPVVDDFTIFNWFDIRSSIEITECYFTPEGPEPDCTPVPAEMLNHDGTTTAYTTDPVSRKVWELEQVDDYGHFRLKAPDGRYFQDLGQMTAANDPTYAAIFTNETLLEFFDVKWVMINPAVAELQEIDVRDKMVTHRESYLRQYSDDYPDLDISKQGLASDKDSEWWNFEKRNQKTNHFEITHYVMKGTSRNVDFPTILDGANDHVYFQRFYNYDETDDNMNLNNLKAHVSLDTDENRSKYINNSNVTKNIQYYLYKNGIVTGERLYWEPSDTYWHQATNNFRFTNIDGTEEFKVAVDVSRYSDYEYENLTNPLLDDLKEPSLTMRYIYYMRDAKVMARTLTKYTEQTGVSNPTAWKELDQSESLKVCTDPTKWMEKKTFHFPSKQVAYENNKWEGYRGEFIGLRHVFSDYWVFNDGNATSTDDNNLVSAVNDNNGGRIEVKIYDPNNTGIRLGGYNPSIGLRGTKNRPLVGDVIRVYYKDKIDEPGDNENDFNPIFKHASDGNPDWTGFQENMTVTDNYFEAPIPNGSLDELFSSGLRLQGRGFTLVKVVCIPQSGYGDRYPLIIYDQETVFNDWGVQPTIRQERIYVGLNNEGNDADYQGFYFYDKMNTAWGAFQDGKTQYGDSRFVVFRYPAGADGKSTAVADDKTGKEAYIHVYFNNGGTRYQLAQFTLIFDKNSETLPWTSVNGSAKVQGTDRDPVNLRKKAGKPIAKITFDYPKGDTYHYPPSGTTLHHQIVRNPNGTIANSSPLPLTFDHTNYSFDGDECNWASYAMVSQKRTEWGNNMQTLPADHKTAGYNIDADEGMEKGFLYIDASEQPGDICAMDFQGEFCEGDILMCTGWISGSNRYSDNGAYRCPGGITLTVKGEPLDGGDTETIYRFCPGQCYELDNGSGIDGSDGANQVVWQQFYFEFSTTRKFKRYWMEVNNNCVSSNGGDFMLDNVEVYAFVPEVVPEMNTPFCISKTASDMQLLKINIGFDKIIEKVEEVEATGEETGVERVISFVFLEKDKFLSTFKTELANRSITVIDGYPGHNGESITNELLEMIIEEGCWGDRVHDGTHYPNYVAAYRAAFNSALLGTRYVWDSEDPNKHKDAAVLNFHWSTKFSEMELYSFAKAVNKQAAVFRETNPESGERMIVMNGNYPNGLEWKINTDYYIVPYNMGTTDTNVANDEHFYADFNICSTCSKKRVFQIKPPLNILSLETSDETKDLEVCEGKIPTLLADMTGYDINGNLVPMKDLNFDWWLGDKTTDPANPVLATLDNYHDLHKVITYKDEHGVTQNEDVHLDVALSTLRAYYKDATDLDGIIQRLSDTPELTRGMTLYLQELVDAGQLVLHQKSISIPAEKTSEDDPYFYLVACPIHDDQFDRSLLYIDNSETPKEMHVAYFCDEPQGLRIKVGERAPSLKCGFVKGENGFDAYNYDFPAGSDPVLSIRLAKAAQFEKVKNEDSEAADGTLSETVHYLWLPIRNAQTETASGVIKKAQDDNIYLASSNDPIWDKKIYKAMSKPVPSLPIVGRIVQLKAVNTKGGINIDAQNTDNRLCVYFTSDFEVREGYNYTLTLPFQEDGGGNACDGTILINLKIVPDYEVWTGGADNTDWNNDQNWRRADGNTSNSNGVNGDELYRKNGALADDDSPLHDYMTNYDNYRSSKDRIFRKGFAPLYCTHVLLKSDEWGDAPVLYDALDGAGSLTAKPFPNLRDEDGWYDAELQTTDTKATATPILKFDMQARSFDIWKETYGTDPEKGREGDLLAEMYQMNTCDEIVFQPGAELLNAHLLNYNSAWVEYQLDNKRWYLLGSPLQGTISGEWYAPTGNAKQETTYYDPIIFGTGYDRYSPAIYQRSWDKAKAVLYEVGADYSTSDNPDDLALTEGRLPGSTQQGYWDNSGQTVIWNSTGADEYLDRLGYKPLGGNKANVALKGIWSNTYNDATVDYTKGGFSVMVMNHLKGSDGSGGTSVIRLPKEDTMYDYYQYSEWGGKEGAGGTDTNLEQVRSFLGRNLNRGRLKTDLLLPTSTRIVESVDNKTSLSERYSDRYGYRTITRVPIKEADLQAMTVGDFTEVVSAGVSNLGYYLVENPFPCGLDMDKFFAGNTGLQKKYWLLTTTGQQLVQQAADGEWVNPSGTDFTNTTHVLAPGQGFFVQANTAGEGTTITFNKAMQVQSRFGKRSGNGTEYTIEVGQTQQMEELKEMVDTDDDGVPDTERTVTILVDDDDDPSTPDVEKPVMTPVYQKEGNDYVLDAEGNRIPVLVPITDKVVVYKYIQDTDDGKVFPLKGRTRGEEIEETTLPGLVITAQRDGNQTSALVMQREEASDDFLPTEDTEVFITSDFESVPTVYTLCGRLATTINSIHEFRSLPLGVESNSDAPCTLTFKGVEALGDSVAFYDALEQTLTPLESGMQVSVSGQTQNRYYLVRSLSKEEAAAETHIQIFTKGLTARVIASTGEPIVSIRCYDTAGRLIHSASPQSTEYSFTLPVSGVYIIEAETENDRKTKKLLAR